MILDNTLEPNAQINIDEMAAQLNVSRTPVHDTLMQLQNKGLVKIVPYAGCFVYRITRKESSEIFQMRCAIESYAARRAAETMPDKILWQWTEQLFQDEKAVLQGNTAAFHRMDALLHDTLIGNLNNRYVLHVMEQITHNSYREQMAAMKSPKNIQCSLEEHHAVVEAMTDRCAKEAEKRMETHICNVARRIETIIFEA